VTGGLVPDGREVSMPKSLDVLIGLSVIMLALGMAVTLITQFVTTVLNTRGRNLRRGLAGLLAQLDPALTDELARTVAGAVLTHPLVSTATGRLGTVVHREEFTKLLLGLAGNRSTLDEAAKKALVSALENNDVKDPAETLAKIRALSLRLEAADPGLAASVRETLAMVGAAPTDLVAKVHNWFDQTMDRVSQRFTASTRAITFVGAVVVAFAFQVDTISLVNRLAADDALREAFVSQGVSMDADVIAERASEAADEQAIERQYLAFMREHGLLNVPASFDEWRARWRETNVPGVLLTSLLLSLGAPFWYSALKKMLQLRSVLAANDDEQRAARQTADKDEPRLRGLLAQVTAQPPPAEPTAAAPTPSPAPPPAGP
jgi:hypothetical protein